MRFGGFDVTFVTITEDPDSLDRYNKPGEIRTETIVKGCHFRPLSSDEKTDATGTTVTERFKLTAPPVLAASTATEIVVDGDRYSIVGTITRYRDMSGRLFKLSATAERIGA